MDSSSKDVVLRNVADALAEDIGKGDLTAALIDSDVISGATIIARESLVLCGEAWVNEVFSQLDSTIVIDWYDAAVGSPIADFVRSSLLIRPPIGASELVHLPESSPDVLRLLHDGYVERVLADLDVTPGVARCWEAVLAAGRLSEHAEADDSVLLALWRGRCTETASPLLDAISAFR